MNRLGFTFAPSPETNDDEVRALVDSADILGRDSLGLDPPEFFRQAALRRSGALIVGRCECGCLGCGDTVVQTAFDERAVTWTLGPTVWSFAPDEYARAVADAAADTGWESVGRTAERLVSGLNFAPIARLEQSFEWASTRFPPGAITLALRLPEGFQRLVSLPWDGRNPETAVAAVTAWLEDGAP